MTAMSTELTPGAGLIASPATQALVVAQKTEITPNPPVNLEDGEAESIATAASALVDTFGKNPKDMALAQTIGTIGAHSQFEATRKARLMQVKLKPLMQATASGEGAIPTGLIEMRKQIKKVDPEELMRQMNQGWVGAVVSQFSNRMKGVLSSIAESYDTAEDVINDIVEGLLRAKGGLQADNIELAGIASEVDECLTGVRKDAYQSELVFQGINALPVPDTRNMLAVRARGAILQRLIGRIQDLRTMEELLLQLAVEMQSIFNGNNELADVIDRSATITRVLLTVGLTNAIALHKQKGVVEVVKGQRVYNAKLLQSVASAAGLGATTIAKLLDDPAITFKALQTAHAKLVGCLDEADKIRSGRVENAQKMLPQMQAMSTELMQRLESLRAIAESTKPAVE
jgi:uncharacterized protein YaaN involved in tellurite resistance